VIIVWPEIRKTIPSPIIRRSGIRSIRWPISDISTRPIVIVDIDVGTVVNVYVVAGSVAIVSRAGGIVVSGSACCS
jgi:hypothetical protein